jgi:DNA-binding XRE family transcriptional regulator
MQSAHTPAGPVTHNQFERPSSGQRVSRAPLAGKHTPSHELSGASSAGAASRTPFYLPIDVSSRFGARLRELRRERNMTQLRMATDFGIDRSFISDVERGRKSISLPMLEVIALGMNMTLSDLLQDI